MGDSVKFSVSLDTKHAVVILEAPELDVEHESNLVLDVYPRECIFTAAPYHARITLDADAIPGKAFPDRIDYEKNTITYRIPLESGATRTEPPKDSFHYGFGQLYQGPLVLESSQELRMLAHPELYSLTDRMKLMRKAEVKDFQCEHYGMDHIQFQIDKLGLTLEGTPSAPKLSDDQSYRIRVIVEEKQRQPDLYTSIEDHQALLLGLIDILLAVGYDRLTNSNELNEANSHTNIQRISATLSFFVEFDCVEEVLQSFYRRSCTYPFYRNKEISKACVNRLLVSAEKFEIREWIKNELMFVYDAFKSTDCAVMNHYYVKDYVRYLELALNDKLLEEYLKEVEKLLTEVHRENLGFGEEETVQQLLMEIMGEEDSDSTDSDDSDSNDEEVESSDSTESDSVVEDKKPNENVLEKLMNLKLSG